MPTPTPVPCTQTLLFQGAGKVPSKVLAAVPFSLSTTARVDVIVDWTFPASHIGVYVVPLNSCTIAAFNARTCNFLIRSDSGPKPRKVSAANVAPGGYDLLIANFATVDESSSTQVFGSTSTCPPLAGQAPNAADASGEGAPEQVNSVGN